MLTLLEKSLLQGQEERLYCLILKLARRLKSPRPWPMGGEWEVDGFTVCPSTSRAGTRLIRVYPPSGKSYSLLLFNLPTPNRVGIVFSSGTLERKGVIDLESAIITWSPLVDYDE